MIGNTANIMKETILGDSLELLDQALPGVLPTTDLLGYMSQ